jgi:hypothetical protein
VVRGLVCPEDVRLPDLRLDLSYSTAILMQRRVFVIRRRRAGADTRPDEAHLAELERKVIKLEER